MSYLYVQMHFNSKSHVDSCMQFPFAKLDFF